MDEFTLPRECSECLYHKKIPDTEEFELWKVKQYNIMWGLKSSELKRTITERRHKEIRKNTIDDAKKKREIIANDILLKTDKEIFNIACDKFNKDWKEKMINRHEKTHEIYSNLMKRAIFIPKQLLVDTDFHRRIEIQKKNMIIEKQNIMFKIIEELRYNIACE